MLANNPNPERETDRALYVALVDWVVKGTLPPASVYPRVSDGTLVPATSAAMGWPNIPNTPKPDGVVNSVLDYDFGPQYRYNDSSGVMTNVPPAVKRVIPTLVSKVDADGNDVGGVKSVLFRRTARHIYGMESDRERHPERPGALAGRRIHSICENQSRAARERRPAPVDRGTLSQSSGVFRGGHACGGHARRRSIAAAG